MLLHHSLELLTRAQCLDLLATERVGRVGISMGALPAVVPVNYSLMGEDIVFCAGERLSGRAALKGSVLGFEVDRIDADSGTGWSVLVVGVAEELSLDEARSRGLEDLSPWAPGEEGRLIRIHPEVVSGQQVAPAQ